MPSITQLIPIGRDFPGPSVTTEEMLRLLGSLEERLLAEGLTWQHVSLLVVANAKGVAEPKMQHDSDAAVIDGLKLFCVDRHWHPSLIGSSVHGAFYHFRGSSTEDIRDGVLLVAVVSQVFRRIPVGVELTKHRAERPLAGSLALRKAISAYATRMQSELGLTIPQHAITETSMGLVFTSGSGHMDETEDVDFKECYAVGQDLLATANAIGAKLYGGCSSNKGDDYQCLYFSEEVGGLVNYRSTYQHSALVALLPHTFAQPQLTHPYSLAPIDPLEIEFDKHDQYADGRFFLVSKINGRPVVEFLAEYWPGADEYLDEWVEKHTAIPRRPEAHGITIGSSASVSQQIIWPNVAIWLEEKDKEILLRLVRAEPQDTNHFLMELAPTPVAALAGNAKLLMESMAFMPYSDDASVLAFLCESRKILLVDSQSNVEAETMLASAPANGALVGIYINGEYSTGTPLSIGYHNYSQIAAIIPATATENLPSNILQARASRGIRLFVCHSSDDKPTAREFVTLVETEVGAHRWIDEEELIVGDDLRDAIRKALKAPNQYVIPFITRRSVNSSWVARELKWALGEEERQQRVCILPVVIDTSGGNTVLKGLKAGLGKKRYAAIESRLGIRVRSLDASEIRAKALQLAKDIKTRAARQEEGRGGT